MDGAQGETQPGGAEGGAAGAGGAGTETQPGGAGTETQPGTAGTEGGTQVVTPGQAQTPPAGTTTQPAGTTTQPAGTTTQPAGGQPAAHALAAPLLVFGQPVQDYGAVQKHITVLEEFQKETRETARKDFVDQLASDNKIAATQLDDLKEFALGLTPDQYSKWQKSWGAAPSSSLFSQHGQTVTNAQGETAQGDETEVHAEVIQSHMRAGMKPEKIKETTSYKKLSVAKPDHPVLSGIL